MITTSNKDFCEIYLKTVIGESVESEEQKSEQKPEETSNVDELTEENTTTIAEDAEEKPKDCRYCHGTGYLKSRCDEPDPVCSSCNGTGIEESVEPSSEEGEQETEVEATISTEDDNMTAEEDETITEDDDNETDGWDEETVELLSDIMEDGEALYYELKNCKRGIYTNCTDRASLGEYLKEYANRIIEIAEEMTNNTAE